jgi:hypothetical protein
MDQCISRYKYNLNTFYQLRFKYYWWALYDIYDKNKLLIFKNHVSRIYLKNIIKPDCINN